MNAYSNIPQMDQFVVALIPRSCITKKPVFPALVSGHLLALPFTSYKEEHFCSLVLKGRRINFLICLDTSEGFLP